MEINEIQKLIHNGKMMEALDEIICLTAELSDGLNRTANVLKSRYVELNNKDLNGINVTSDMNQIREDTFKILHEIEHLTNQKPMDTGTQLPVSPEDEYYKLYGLRGLRTSTIIQDFNIGRAETHNINAIQFLWADALYGNTITAKHIGDGKTLRIQFNHYGGWGSNIAIRSQDGIACHNLKKYKYLCFDTSIPVKERRKIQKMTKSRLLDEIGISIRIVNGRLQHWEYAHNPREYIVFPVTTSEWGEKRIKLNLADKNFWYLFTSDGNIKSVSQDPDFSIIASVVLKFGSMPVCSNEPEPGSGIVDIRAITLTDD